MKYIASLMLACAASLSPSFPLMADSAPVAEKKTGFEAGKGQFLLNGEPFVVKAAELHYPRIPRPYWEHRIQMCKALGMNTICLYVFGMPTSRHPTTSISLDRTTCATSLSSAPKTT